MSFTIWEESVGGTERAIPVTIATRTKTASRTRKIGETTISLATVTKTKHYQKQETTKTNNKNNISSKSISNNNEINNNTNKFTDNKHHQQKQSKH